MAQSQFVLLHCTKWSRTNCLDCPGQDLWPNITQHYDISYCWSRSRPRRHAKNSSTDLCTFKPSQPLIYAKSWQCDILTSRVTAPGGHSERPSVSIHQYRSEILETYELHLENKPMRMFFSCHFSCVKLVSIHEIVTHNDITKCFQQGRPGEETEHLKLQNVPRFHWVVSYTGQTNNWPMHNLLPQNIINQKWKHE